MLLPRTFTAPEAAQDPALVPEHLLVLGSGTSSEFVAGGAVDFADVAGPGLESVVFSGKGGSTRITEAHAMRSVFEKRFNGSAAQLIEDPDAFTTLENVINYARISVQNDHDPDKRIGVVSFSSQASRGAALLEHMMPDNDIVALSVGEQSLSSRVNAWHRLERCLDINLFGIMAKALQAEKGDVDQMEEVAKHYASLKSSSVADRLRLISPGYGLRPNQ